MKLFEFSVIYNPTKMTLEKNPEAKAKILVQPKTILAANHDRAGMVAAREIPAEFLDNLEDVEIAVRPF